MGQLYNVHFEYGNSNVWDTDIDQPAIAVTLEEARRLRDKWLNEPTSSHDTRVRIVPIIRRSKQAVLDG